MRYRPNNCSSKTSGCSIRNSVPTTTDQMASVGLDKEMAVEGGMNEEEEEDIVAGEARVAEVSTLALDRIRFGLKTAPVHDIL